MSKEELYNSLKSNSPISRKDIDKHLSGDHELNSAELENFEKEAIEGWRSSSSRKVSMKNLDRKFAHSDFGWWIAGSISVLGLVAFFYFNPFSSTIISSQTNRTVENKNYIEETDLFIAEKYDTLIEDEGDNKKEIKLLQVIQEYQPTIFKEGKVEEPIVIEKLPILEVKPNLNEKPLSISTKRKIKEIYLSNFKLVDYRVLRSKPKIETRQLDLTGTAANKEHKNTEDNNEPVWRKVDVPYYDFIEKSMYILNKNEMKKSLARFEVILTTYPDDINALFYSGFAFYNLGDYDQSISYFSKVIKSEIANFDEEAMWYLGLSYEKKGDNTRARNIFLTISRSTSYYADQAKEKIK